MKPKDGVILSSNEILQIGSEHWGSHSIKEWLRLIAYQLTLANEWKEQELAANEKPIRARR